LQLIELLRSHNQFWNKGGDEGVGEGKPSAISLEPLQLFKKGKKEVKSGLRGGRERERLRACRDRGVVLELLN
jgi:hypothetical protein